MCAVYGEGAVTDAAHRKWFAKLCATDFLLDDAPRSDRPIEVDSDRIETLIEINRHAITWNSWHAQNIQINKVIDENEKCVFYFTGKKIRTFWPTQYFQMPCFPGRHCFVTSTPTVSTSTSYKNVARCFSVLFHSTSPLHPQSSVEFICTPCSSSC